MEKVSFKKLNEVEGKERYRVEVSNRFAALEDLNSGVEINGLGKDYRKYRNFSQRECRLF
jgi:hypothetical protein